jgi:hypothetical protein
MLRSFAQTILIFLAAGLLILFNSTSLDAQESSGSATSNGGSVSDKLIEKELADIDGLVRESDRRGSSMHKQLRDYSYTLVKVRRTLNDKGRITSENVQTFEAYPVQRGLHVLVKTSDNRIPTPGWMIELDRRRAGDELASIEFAEQKREETAGPAPPKHLQATVTANLGGRYAAVMIDISDFLRTCEFSAPRRERINGRDAIVLDFRPRAGVNRSYDTAFIGKLAGTVWIDAADRVVTRLEGWPTPEAAPPASQPVSQSNPSSNSQSSLKPGAQSYAQSTSQPTAQPGAAQEAQAASPAEPAIIYQQVRLSTGLWAPTLIRMNAGGNGALFDGFNWDVLFQFSDYKHFSTDVKGVEYEKPKRQP